MGRTLQNVNKRYADGARPVVNEVPMTDGEGHFLGRTTVSTVAVAGVVTYTPPQVLGKLILRDCNGDSRSDVLPTAALLLAEIQNDGQAEAGVSVEFTVRNTSDAAETITIGAGTGGTTSGTMTIAQNNTKRFLLVFTNTSAGSEAYTVYSLGTSVS